MTIVRPWEDFIVASTLSPSHFVAVFGSLEVIVVDLIGVALVISTLSAIV